MYRKIKNFVYCLIHDNCGNFLIFTKRRFGNYFKTGPNKGVFLYEGQLLNSAGKKTFPGGKIEGPITPENIKINAKRELYEETGVILDYYDISQRYYGGVNKKIDLYYYAVYFRFDDLKTLMYNIRDKLVESDNIVNHIRNNWYYYNKLKPSELYHNKILNRNVPVDNELYDVNVWNINQDKMMIDAIRNSSDWIYNIIKNFYGI